MFFGNSKGEEESNVRVDTGKGNLALSQPEISAAALRWAP
jgi:hypothetical protein